MTANDVTANRLTNLDRAAMADAVNAAIRGGECGANLDQVAYDTIGVVPWALTDEERADVARIVTAADRRAQARLTEQLTQGVAA